jgi:multidrug resistance efflux pump
VIWLLVALFPLFALGLLCMQLWMGKVHLQGEVNHLRSRLARQEQSIQDQQAQIQDQQARFEQAKELIRVQQSQLNVRRNMQIRDLLKDSPWLESLEEAVGDPQHQQHDEEQRS